MARDHFESGNECGHRVGFHLTTSERDAKNDAHAPPDDVFDRGYGNFPVRWGKRAKLLIKGILDIWETRAGGEKTRGRIARQVSSSPETDEERSIDVS